MKIHILQHTQETGPGQALEWLAARSVPYTITRFFKGEALPSVDAVDFLIICGGAMGVRDEAEFPWLRAEKAFIKNCLDQNKTVLGLCLGSQLIASVLGADVKRHCAWEVGWVDVQILGHGPLRVFQYHQDTFSLPPGAERIASNEFCLNQGYRLGDKVMAFQFHPEATEAWVKYLADDPELPKGAHVQTPAEMLAGRSDLPEQRRWFFAQLDRLAKVTSETKR